MLKFASVLLLSSFLMFWRLGDTHLTNWDEAWYGAVSRTMAEKGNVLTPMWNGEPFLEKPPLFYWLTAISYKIFGDKEFSARFISALAGVGTTLLVYKFSGITSALILLSIPAFLWRARTGNLDSLLTFLIVLSATTKFTGIFSGLAFLTKGFIGFLYPLITNVRSLFIAIAIAIAWFFVSFFVNGELFIQQFFAQQGEKIISGHFSFGYIWHLKTGLKLWIIIFIPALYYGRKLPFSRFVIVYLVLLSFFREKSTWFLMPVYPFIALICGQFLSRWKKTTILVFTIAIFQLAYYRAEYFVPDIASDEARVAIASREFSKEDDIIYLTHYYFPTAVYYSRRKTYAVYSERPSITWWILPKSAWADILHKNSVFINTTRDDLKVLQQQYPAVHFEILFSSSDKLLVKKV